MIFFFFSFGERFSTNHQGMLILFSVVSNEIKAVSLVRDEYTVSTTMCLHRQNDFYLY